MTRYLIFRTDRIGDFIFSRIITDAIKKQNSSNKIDFVCSKYNSNYAKNYKDINKIYILDKSNLKIMLKNLLEINSIKYDKILVLDGKRRSILFSIFLNSKFKLAVIKDWRPLLILKLFFNKFLINSEIKSQFDNFVSVANIIDLKVNKKIDYYHSYKFKKNNKKCLKPNYTLLHLDEKWFENYYYKDFDYMNLNEKNFKLFVDTIFKKFKKNILITTGSIKIPLLEKILKKYFKKIDDNEFISIKHKNKLRFINNTDFQDLENIVKKANNLICCEGAISHVSHALGINTIALVNYTGINTGVFWTSHMNKIKLLYRNDIKIVCKLISKIK
ncbi:glycosyltransferase family 9 protein [Candidatus Pelagibacter sp. HIMB1709]|uniref:glycosyltransferase family 9 protein n=1 Tax=Candidatus Pelagibacter sp. HIMB1709 TaxID=3413367 RepID=UPI003F830EFB